MFKNIPFTKNACVLIDVKEVIMGKKEIELKSYAWTIVPLFSFDGFVNSGIYQIPLFKG